MEPGEHSSSTAGEVLLHPQIHVCQEVPGWRDATPKLCSEELESSGVTILAMGSVPG